MAKFRLRQRHEVQINWKYLNFNTLVYVIGKLRHLYNLGLYYYSGGMFKLYQGIRNEKAADYIQEYNVDFGSGHLQFSVTPSTVSFKTRLLVSF